jgi:hypothetical protein
MVKALRLRMMLTSPFSFLAISDRKEVTRVVGSTKRYLGSKTWLACSDPALAKFDTHFQSFQAEMTVFLAKAKSTLNSLTFAEKLAARVHETDLQVNRYRQELEKLVETASGPSRSKDIRDGQLRLVNAADARKLTLWKVDRVLDGNPSVS